MIAQTIEQRKQDHIDINIDRDVESHTVSTGFERYRFIHNALPELHPDDIDMRQSFLGKTLRAPLLISSMTGGLERGWELTQRLAVVAETVGCAIGVGSQRAAIEDPARSRFFAVRSVAPQVMLFANLGAVQLNYGFGADECRRAVEMIEADALVLHLNSLQEALQSDGNRNFRSLAGRISEVCSASEVPVIVKEVGFGISAGVAHRLVECGVSAIDVSGAGGTSWSVVEHFRADDRARRALGRTFADWGIPTATSLQMARAGAPQLPLIASGGLRDGIDVAKALALGASLAGVAGPLLRAAAASEEDALAAVELLVEELRLAMFCTGSGSLASLTPDLLIAAGQAPSAERDGYTPIQNPAGAAPNGRSAVNGHHGGASG